MGLKQRLVSGVIWSAFDSFSGLAIQMVCTLIVARLLTPADFGIVGMVTVFSAIGLIIIDSGFGQALIRKQDATETDYTSVFYLNIVLSVLVYFILYLCSPFIEDFYEIAGLSKISRVLFLIIPINAIGLIQNTILTKKVNFKTLGIISFISALISGIIGIIIAYKTRSVWAIVLQTIGMYAIRTLLLWLIPKWKPIRQFSFASIKEMFPYASNLMFTGLFGTIVNNISPLIIGKIYDATQLGFYSQADKFQKLPSTTATGIIQRVTFPILVEIQDDNAKLRDAYSRILKQAVYIISPIMFFLMATAPQLFYILLGEKWLTAAAYFQILCISGLLYPISCLSLNLINVKGNSRLLFYLEVLRKVIFVVIIAISMFFSIYFFIWMQAINSMIQLVINLYYSGKMIDFGFISQMKVSLPIMLFALGCSIPCLCLNYLTTLSQYWTFPLDVFIYFGAYLSISQILRLQPYAECKDVLNKYLRKKKAA